MKDSLQEGNRWTSDWEIYNVPALTISANKGDLSLVVTIYTNTESLLVAEELRWDELFWTTTLESSVIGKHSSLNRAIVEAELYAQEWLKS